MMVCRLLNKSYVLNKKTLSFDASFLNSEWRMTGFRFMKTVGEYSE